MGPLLVGVTFGLGVWLLGRWLFPPRRTLAETLDRPVSSSSASPNTALRSWWGTVAVAVLSRIKADSMEDLEADLAVTDIDLEAHAIDRLNAALAGGAIVVALARFAGWTSGTAGSVVAYVIGAALSYWIPELEVRRKASERRAEFVESLNAFVTLVAVSIAGGGGVNSAMKDTTSLGGGWPFEMIRQTLDESTLFGESPWVALDRLGRRVDVEELVELAGALSLAGVSGARVADTLRSRAESGRQKALAEAKAEAEAKSESMNMPIAVMLLGWVIFMGYPAIAALLGS